MASTRTVRVHADPLRTPPQTLTMRVTGALYTFLRQPESLSEYPDGHRTSANAGSAPGAKPSETPFTERREPHQTIDHNRHRQHPQQNPAATTPPH